MKRQVFILLTIVALCIQFGCGTTNSPQRIAYKSTETVVVSADTAMKTWASYVVAQRKLVLADPQKLAVLNNHENQVRDAYQKYQLAVRSIIAAQMAVSANSTNSVTIQVGAAITSASGPLLQLISQFIQ